MADEQNPAEQVGDEVVQTPEAVEAEAAEAPESTEGQEQDQPADPEAPEGEDGEDKASRSKQRRERRKAHMEALERQRQELEAENRRLQEQLAELDQFTSTPKPTQDQYETYEDYLAALSAYNAMQAQDNRAKDRLKREQEEKQRQRQELDAQSMKEARESWAAQAEEARAIYTDFDAVTGAPDLAITEHMAAFLGHSDVGADLAYHLGMNKEQARVIAQMPAQAQPGAMRLLEQMMPRRRAAPVTPTQAPDPVTPVRPKATGAKSPDDMSMDEWIAARKAGKIK